MSDDRATAAWKALLASARRAGHDGGHYLAQDQHGRTPAYLWPLSQVLHASAIVGDDDTWQLACTQLARYRRRGGAGLAHFPGARACYFDDNAWVGLAAAQRVLDNGGDGGGDDGGGGPTEPDREAPAAVVDAAWRFCDRGRRTDGGVRWRDERRSPVNTCSTAPVAALALRAADAGVLDATTALDAAYRATIFLDERLRRDDGLFADHLDVDDRVDWGVFSYNQGVPAAVHVLLARHHGEGSPARERHLRRAHEIADAALHEFAGDRLFTHPPAFNAIFFRNLLVLDAHSPRADVRPALDAYLERVWDEARDPSTGLFVAGGIGTYDGASTIDQAALTQLYAVATWPRRRAARLC